MRRDARQFLIAGCVLVGTLELPRALPSVRAAFQGPYPEFAQSSAPDGLAARETSWDVVVDDAAAVASAAVLEPHAGIVPTIAPAFALPFAPGAGAAVKRPR